MVLWVKLLNSFYLRLWVILIVNCFVSSMIFFWCLWSGGKVIILNVRWLSKLFLNLFCLVSVGKFLLVVYIKWVFILIVCLLLMCLNLLYLIMCRSFFCIIVEVLVNLLRNSVLLLVCLKWFLWCLLVLVNVLFLWLNNLFLSRFLLSVV